MVRRLTIQIVSENFSFKRARAQLLSISESTLGQSPAVVTLQGTPVPMGDIPVASEYRLENDRIESVDVRDDIRSVLVAFHDIDVVAKRDGQSAKLPGLSLGNVTLSADDVERGLVQLPIAARALARVTVRDANDQAVPRRKINILHDRVEGAMEAFVDDNGQMILLLSDGAYRISLVRQSSDEPRTALTMVVDASTPDVLELTLRAR